MGDFKRKINHESDWTFAFNSFRLPTTIEGIGHLTTCVNPFHPPLRIPGEFPWFAVIYERGPGNPCSYWKVLARVHSQEPYCAVSINNILEPLGLWLPSTAEVIVNGARLFFCGEHGTIQVIEKRFALKERRNVCAMAEHN